MLHGSSDHNHIHYLLKVVMALLRGILILRPLRESVLLLHIISKRFLYKKYDQLFVTWLMQKIHAGCSSFWTSWNWENALCKDIGKGKWLPFVFASGAEFTDIEKSGAAWINEMFSIARRNASILSSH
ncbi:hypothetical protein ACJW31_11G019900 [Castanea mollissima]